MMVGKYTLDLYCDTKVRKGWNFPTGSDKLHPFAKGYGRGYAQFTGATQALAVKAARAAGWKVNLKEGTCYCPLCTTRS